MAHGNHTFVNPIADDPTFTGTKPSDWNADIPVTLDADENFVTDAEKVVIGNTSGINTGDQDLSGLEPKNVNIQQHIAIVAGNPHGTVPTDITGFAAAALAAAPAETTSTLNTLLAASTADTTPLDTDELISLRSGTLRTTWLNCKDFLKSYFDTLYYSIAKGNTCVRVLYNNAVPVSIYNISGWLASPLTEHVLRSYTMPGGTMGANGRLRFSHQGTGNSLSNNKTIKLYIGAGRFFSVQLTTSSVWDTLNSLRNRNSESSQIGGINFQASTISSAIISNAPSVLSINTALDQIITLTAQTTLETAITLAATSDISGTGSVATVNKTAHGYNSGEYILTTLSSTAGYNVGPVMVTRITADQFTYPCTGTGTPTTAPSFQRYSNIISEAMTIELIP